MEKPCFTTDWHDQRTPKTIFGLQTKIIVKIRSKQKDKTNYDAQTPAKIHPQRQKKKTRPNSKQTQQKNQ